MTVTNHCMVFNDIPETFPVPGKTIKLTESSLDVDNVKLSGGVLVKLVALSIDPYMRGKMRSAEKESYTPAFALGQPMGTLGIGKVVRSEAEGLPEGAVVYGGLPMSEYAVMPAGAAKGLKVVKNEYDLPLSYFVGTLGMPGHTAFYGLYEILKPKKGEAIFVSAASGAVGFMVAQLAHREGVKVIGSAGSDEKVSTMKESGVFDVAFNYKKEDTAEILKANPFDMYFDNVGGETLDAVLEHINKFGRIAACGAISQYNVKASERYGLKNNFYIIGKELLVQGYIISGKDASEFEKKVPEWVSKGEIKVREHRIEGLDQGEGFLALMEGRNHGKAVHVLEK